MAEYLTDPVWPPSRVESLANHLGSHQKLADRLGVARETVTRWCAGDQRPLPALKRQMDRIARKSKFVEQGVAGAN